MTPVILIADSEPDLAANCERLLRPFGYICWIATTGPDALARINEATPDIVVADLRLPGSDGLVLARHARAHVPPIPVILMTAYDSAWAQSAAREAGATVYLAKPFTNAAFLDAVRRIMVSDA